MEQHDVGSQNQYALRIEGHRWLDDLTIEQMWAVLKAAYQHLTQDQDLLFIALLPTGEMPAKCLPKSMFNLCLRSPALLAQALTASAAPDNNQTLIVAAQNF